MALQEREWTFDDDKAQWGDGPWLHEPDKAQWEDEATALPCLAVRNHSGAWCGYVGVAEDHPAFGKKYDEVHVECHGGLTYSDFCQDRDDEKGICHVVDDEQRVWWLGFDCAHAWDLVPGMLAHVGTMNMGETYRDLDYVKGQCRRLAEQLAAQAHR